MIEAFLTLPIGIRLSLLLAIAFLLWCVLGRLILKALSLIPLLVKYILIGFYLVLELPVSALHRKFGGCFGTADRKLAGFFRSIASMLDGLVRLLKNPKDLCRISLILLLIVSAYLIVPQLLGLNGGAFVFWHDGYAQFESQLVKFLGDQDWVHHLVVYQ